MIEKISRKILEEKLSNILEESKDYIAYIATTYNNFNSPHEGYAIILDELDELWSEIKKDPSNRNTIEMSHECKRIIAAATCFMLYCCQNN